MISWLLVIIVSYLFFSLSSLGDKLVLSDSADPKSYTFFVGIVNIFVIVLIPFASFGLPHALSFFWMFLGAAAFIIAIYLSFRAVKKFNISQVVPAMGTLQPLSTLALTWLFFGPQLIKPIHWLAFVVLLIGGFIISLKDNLKINREYLWLVCTASLLFAADNVFLKLVFVREPFLQGFIWSRLLIFLFAFVFLLDRKFARKVFDKTQILNRKTGMLFAATQSLGALGYFLQNFAISLAPVAYLAVMNSLRGIQYVFLLMITLIFSYLYPKILKEDLSRRTIIQKVLATVLIVAGLAMLFS